DKMLVNIAGKLGKKFGAKVGQSKIKVPAAHPTDDDVFAARALLPHDEPQFVRDELEALGNALRNGADYDLAVQPLSRRARQFVDNIRPDQYTGKPTSHDVHTLAITDDLRKAATEQGFPLFQGGEEGPRGRITLNSNQAVVDLFKNSDASTFMHEAGHLWLDELTRDASSPDAPKQLKDDLAKVLKWLGVDKPENIGREHHEQWAQGFEQYLAEGKAPSSSLQPAFEQFRQWLASIYQGIARSGVQLSDDVRGVMDRLLATDQDISLASDLGVIGKARAPGSEGIGPEARK